ncbi:phosphatidylglycerophosphatase A [Geotalea uraniireducens]|uniref:Phosphatidylglycerophosphatase A n=1 Tax=Geotalea uraniireducens TaxID=351604 RepID=A0ABM8EQ06_9BACT|nr:phosphatidylglycerophosphatase A [Geotalea uraniireducens]BDV44700.1 phosphatidylglycerophosphatase A [Geotalea uraniireducens]
MRRFVVLAATWFGTGFSPVASGTVGTLGAIPFYLILARMPLWLYLATLVPFFFFACWAAGRAEALFGEHDSGKIVIDEVIGYLVTMAAVPPAPRYVVAGFFLFRFFDIVKVPPARFFDRQVHNGYGVVLDDVVAGLYACAVLHLLTRWL